MKAWSLGYEILRTYVRFAFWLTHNQIVVVGRDLIPENKPIIFAPNHQNALMDPLALVCTNKNQTVWLARADIFKSKIAQKILAFMKMLPVYRIRDGKDNLSNNENVFSKVGEILEAGLTVGLFPEAAHSGKRQMLPHKKAIPRIALETENKNGFNLHIQIVPTGIYYDHYWHFNRTLIVIYGIPINVDKYKSDYQENPQKVMLSLRDEIYGKLRPLTMQIESKQYYSEYELIRVIAGKKYSKSFSFSKNKTLQNYYSDIDLIKSIEKNELKKQAEFENLINKIQTLNSESKKSGLNIVELKQVNNSSFLKNFIGLFAVLLSLPFFITGFVFNAVPFFVPRYLFGKKIRDNAFRSTFNLVAGLIIFPVFYLISFSILYSTTGSLLFSLIIFLLMPVLGKYSFKLLQFYLKVFKVLSITSGIRIKKCSLQNLLNQFQNIENLIISLARQQ